MSTPDPRLEPICDPAGSPVSPASHGLTAQVVQYIVSVKLDCRLRDVKVLGYHYRHDLNTGWGLTSLRYVLEVFYSTPSEEGSFRCLVKVPVTTAYRVKPNTDELMKHFVEVGIPKMFAREILFYSEVVSKCETKAKSYGNYLNIPIPRLYYSRWKTAEDLLVDSRGVSVDSRGVSVDSRGVSVDSSGVSVDSSGVSVDSSGVSLDSGGLSLDSSGVLVDSRGVSVDSRGVSVDSSGVLVDSRGVSVDSSGVLVDSSGVLVDNSGVSVYSSGVLVGSSGVLVDSSGVLVGSSGVLVDSSFVSVDSSGESVDSSGALMDSRGVSADSRGVSVDGVLHLTELLVLEYLDGFHVDSRDDKDFNHLRLIASALGRLHALGRAVGLCDPALVERLRADWTILPGSLNDSVANRELRMLAAFLKHHGDEESAGRLMLLGTGNRLQQEYHQALDQHHRHAVLLHLDLWSGNFLFLYDPDSGVPQDVKIVDMQLVALGSSGCDLAVLQLMWRDFLTSRISLLKTYMAAFRRQVSALGMKPSCCTVPELLRLIDRDYFCMLVYWCVKGSPLHAVALQHTVSRSLISQTDAGATREQLAADIEQSGCSPVLSTIFQNIIQDLSRAKYL